MIRKGKKPYDRLIETHMYLIVVHLFLVFIVELANLLPSDVQLAK